METVITLMIFVLIILPLLVYAEEKHKEAIAEEQRRQERAQKEEQRRREQEERQRLIAAEKQRREEARQQERERREKEKQRTLDCRLAEKETIRLHKAIFKATSVPRLYAALPTARIDFEKIDLKLLSDASTPLYVEISEILKKTNAQIVDQYIFNQYEAICQTAFEPVSVEEFTNKINVFFREMRKAWDCISEDTHVLLEEKMEEMGVQL